MKATDGRQLRAARAILGLTVDETARLADVNRNSVLKAEKWTRLPRRAWAADRIAEAFADLGVVCEASETDLAVRFAPEASQ